MSTEVLVEIRNLVVQAARTSSHWALRALVPAALTAMSLMRFPGPRSHGTWQLRQNGQKGWRWWSILIWNGQAKSTSDSAPATSPSCVYFLRSQKLMWPSDPTQMTPVRSLFLTVLTMAWQSKCSWCSAMFLRSKHSDQRSSVPARADSKSRSMSQFEASSAGVKLRTPSETNI